MERLSALVKTDSVLGSSQSHAREIYARHIFGGGFFKTSLQLGIGCKTGCMTMDVKLADSSLWD